MVKTCMYTFMTTITLCLITASTGLMADNQLIKLPKSTASKVITQIAYVDAYDELSNIDYAVLAFVEDDRKKTKQLLKIWSMGLERKSSVNPREPKFRKQMSDAAVAGRDYFIVGHDLKPTSDDPRLMEFRIYFDEATMKPKHLELNLAVRNENGSAKEAENIKIDWSELKIESGDDARLLSAPASDKKYQNEELAYIHAYDVVSNKDYAYVAYKETKLSTGKWKIRIKAHAKVTADTFIEPGNAILKRNITAAAKEGKDYALHGFSMTPSEKDPRLVETRVYFDAAQKPSYVELHVVTRNSDGTPKDKQMVKFNWPG